MKRAAYVPLTLAALALLSGGCGYRLVGHGAAARSLWIAPVEDDGDQPLFGATLATDLHRQAVDLGALEVGRQAGADARLTVRVDKVAEVGAAFVKGDLVREYVLRGVVTATLANASGKVLWRGGGIRADRPFAAGQSVNETEANKQRALALLSGDLAREVLRRVSLILAGTR
jgi:outer membrane lipopolysaccharide assembly protein LptE/RlpB